MAANKRIDEKQIDRLSPLPDSLLIHILAFLEMKEAAITCLLSKRWKFLWTELPRLAFREYCWISEENHRFVARVNRTLVICSKTNLERFDVSFWYRDRFAYDVNVWVEFAVKNKVKEVCLELTCRRDKHRLRQMMYTNSSLTSLFLKGCIMAPRETVDWPSLTELQLEGVELHQHVIENILSGCPVLHSLVLRDCYGYNCLEVNSRSLYKLTVMDPAIGSEPCTKISAPYVHCLSILLYPVKTKLHLTNIPSLVSADIEFIGCHWNYSFEEVMSHAKELLEKTQHVKALKLGVNFVNVVSEMVVKGWQLPQTRLHWLTISVGFPKKHDNSGIMRLLESSPNIQTLIIDIRYSPFFSEESITGGQTARDEDLDRDLLHLKAVEIKCSVQPNLCIDQLLTMARILLKWATVLEEMAIVTNVKDVNVIAKISQPLLTYPRSSRKAIVVLR